MSRQKLITTKSVFSVSLLVTVLTILAIWLFGLGQHRTLFQNSLLSTSILSVAFLLFLTIGLYKGIKLKDDIGKITDRIKTENLPDMSMGLDLPSAIPEVGEGLAGIVLGILAWIVFSFLLLVFVWIFGTLMWVMVLAFVAMLYWIFFRALRLVFKRSRKCNGDLKASIAYGLGYTVLYNFWIYGIILSTHYIS